MLNRIKQYILGSNEYKKKSLHVVFEELNTIRKNTNYLAICPQNTQGNWLGIKRGTLALFGDSTFCIDQYYSNQVYSDDELNIITQTILELQFESCFLRGFPPYFEKIINALSKGNINIWVLYAGPVSEFNEEKKRNNFSKIISLAQDKKIHGIGFNKMGLPEVVNKLYKVKTHRYILKAPTINFSSEEKYTGINIGVFGGKTFNKNIHSQVMAGLSVSDEAKVHVMDNKSFDYLQMNNRIIGKNGYLNHSSFLKELSKMSINTYLAFSESWGNVIMESASVGVPCLTTANNGIYNFSDELKRNLVVENYDDINEIKNKIKTVLEKRSELKPLLLEYCETVNLEADRILSDLLKV